MRRFFFLPPQVSYLLIAVMIISFWQLPLFIQVPVILISSLILFVSRRSYVPFRDTLKNNGEIYLSPIHGVVESVRYSIDHPDFTSPCHEVRISLSFWDGKGLYLPISGEVSYLKAGKGKKLHRSSSTDLFYAPIEELSHTDLTLTSINKSLSLLRFIDCSFGKRPTIWLKSGDRGRAGACFGYYPFGGTLLIYLPVSTDILVFKNETVTPGQTVIGTLKEST